MFIFLILTLFLAFKVFLSFLGYGDIASYLSLNLDESMNGRGAECVLSYRGWDNAVKATYTIQTSKYKHITYKHSNCRGFSS